MDDYYLVAHAFRDEHRLTFCNLMMSVHLRKPGVDTVGFGLLRDRTIISSVKGKNEVVA